MPSREPLLVENGLVVYPGSVSYPALAPTVVVNDFGSIGLFNWSKSGDRGW